MRYSVSADMLDDAARARSNGEPWAAIGRQWGVSGQTAKRMYLRKSCEVYGDPRKSDGTTELEKLGTMPDQIVRCGYMISGEPEPCGMRIERDGGTWRHEYRKVDRHHDAVPAGECPSCGLPSGDGSICAYCTAQGTVLTSRGWVLTSPACDECGLPYGPDAGAGGCRCYP